MTQVEALAKDAPTETRQTAYNLRLAQACRSECGPRRWLWMLSSDKRLLTKWYKAPAESGRNGALRVRKISGRAQHGRTC
jgi:hypothetical protein